jgi:hypothetical protein
MRFLVALFAVAALALSAGAVEVTQDLYLTTADCFSSVVGQLRVPNTSACTQMGLAPLIGAPNACTAVRSCTIGVLSASNNVLDIGKAVKCLYNGESSLFAAYVADVFANGTIVTDMWISSGPVFCSGSPQFSYTFNATDGCAAIVTRDSAATACMSTQPAPMGTSTSSGGGDGDGDSASGAAATPSLF